MSQNHANVSTVIRHRFTTIATSDQQADKIGEKITAVTAITAITADSLEGSIPAANLQLISDKSNKCDNAVNQEGARASHLQKRRYASVTLKSRRYKRDKRDFMHAFYARDKCNKRDVYGRLATLHARRMDILDPLADDAPAALADLATAGMTADEIANRLGMTAEAVRAHPDYARAPLTEDHDGRVARALYERAVGAVTWTDTMTKLGERIRLEKREAPDPNAAKLWLQARRKAEWGSDAGEGARVYVVQLPPMASDAAAWMQAVAADRAAQVSRVIEHQAPGGGPAKPVPE